MSFINLERVIEKLRNPNNSLAERKEAAKLLGQTGAEAAVDALVDFLNEPAMRVDVVQALGRLAHPKALKFLLTAIFDADTDAKLEIIRALRRIGDLKAMGPLLQFYLQEKDENVKSAAFILITQYGSFDDVFNIIPGSLKSEHKNIQMLALKYLYDAGDARAAHLLYPLLFHEDPKIKSTAGEVLWKYEGQKLLDRLNYVLLKTKDLPKRLDVAYVYGELGIIQEVAPLVYALIHDEDETLRVEVLRALRKIGDVRAIKPIVQVMLQATEKVVAAGLEALSAFNRPEIPKIVSRFLAHKSEIVREAAKAAFERIVTPADLPTVKAFFASEDPRNLVFVIGILGKLNVVDDAILEFLRKMLGHANDDVVIEACRTLGKLRVNKLNPLLIERFRHPNEEVRTAAIKACGKIADESALEPIAGLYKGEASHKVRATIINVMGDFKKKSFMSTVREALKDPDARVRSNAIEAMEAMGGEEIVDHIYPLLEDENNRVKANAAKTLWKFGGIRMIGVLEKMLLREKDKWQRASAAFSLGEIGALQVVKPLLMAMKDGEDCVRKNVVKALGKTNSREVMNDLIPALDDPSEEVRDEAIIALGRVGGLEILEPLVKYLKDHNEHKVMDHIFKSIEKTVDHTFLLPLTRLIQEEGGLVRILAARLLANIGEESTIPVLKELLDDGNVNIRTTAEHAIRAIGARVKAKREAEGPAPGVGDEGPPPT